MNQINIDDCYFHGLAGGVPFWEKDKLIQLSLEQLNLIVTSGGIYSRKELKEKFNIEYNDKEPLYNGDKYISVCIKHPLVEEFKNEFNDIDPAFFRYVRYKISIAIDPLKVHDNMRTDKYKHLPGERQITDYIDISCFRAIVVGESIDVDLINDIESIVGNHNIPIVDIEGNSYCSNLTNNDLDNKYLNQK